MIFFVEQKHVMNGHASKYMKNMHMFHCTTRILKTFFKEKTHAKSVRLDGPHCSFCSAKYLKMEFVHIALLVTNFKMKGDKTYAKNIASLFQTPLNVW